MHRIHSVTESNPRSLWVQPLLWFRVHVLDGVRIEQIRKGIAPRVWIGDKREKEEVKNWEKEEEDLPVVGVLLDTVFIIIFGIFYWSTTLGKTLMFLHILLGMPRMQNPDHSLPGPFLMVAFAAHNLEGQGYVSLRTESGLGYCLLQIGAFPKPSVPPLWCETATWTASCHSCGTWGTRGTYEICWYLSCLLSCK